MNSCVTINDVELISAGLTAITLIIAVLGLSTWKNQLYGSKRYESLNKLQSEILLLNLQLNRTFSLINQYFTFSIDSEEKKSAIKIFFNSDYKNLTSKKEDLHKTITSSLPIFKQTPNDPSSIIYSLSEILNNYEHFISMIEKGKSEYDFFGDKKNFSFEKLDEYIKSTYDYINGYK